MAMLHVLCPPPAAAAWVEGAIAVRLAPGQHITRFPAMPNAMLAVRLWPHAAALLWQLLWVAITIWISAGLFRRGVLKSGPGLLSFLRRRKA